MKNKQENMKRKLISLNENLEESLMKEIDIENFLVMSTKYLKLVWQNFNIEQDFSKMARKK